MKLSFSPASPFARKVRIAAIELGLIDKIEFVPATVVPGQPNDEYSRITPLKKLPVLTLDNGDVILDSYVIAEYLDDLAGGGKLIPKGGAARWKVKSDHSMLQGMLDSMLLCRYENMVRPEPLRWQAWADDHWNRAWNGMARFEKQEEMLSRPLDIAQIALVCVLGYADFRFPACGWRKAYPKLDAFHEKMLARPSVQISVPPPSSPVGKTGGRRVDESKVHRRRPHHPSHHRAGNHVPAGARDAAQPDARRARGEQGVDEGSIRNRRERCTNPVFPVLHREDAVSHHSGRQLHRQRQAAAAAPEMEHENRQHLYARACEGQFFRR
jgi:glutathione S-transferase